MARQTLQLILVPAFILAVTAPSVIAQSKKKAAPAATYKQVQGIFNKNCVGCHQGANPPAKMNLKDYMGTMKGNDDGAVVIPGHPEKSLLVKVITKTGRGQMPPKKSLSKAEIATIQAWIKGGAKK